MKQELTREQKEILKECDLSQLDRPDFKRRPEEKKTDMELETQEIQRYMDKYGKDGLRRYVEDHNPHFDYDPVARYDNTLIHLGVFRPLSGRSCTPEAAISHIHRFNKRLVALFGTDSVKVCGMKSKEERVEALLRDASKTGRWRDLPKELHEIYHRRYPSRA